MKKKSALLSLTLILSVLLVLTACGGGGNTAAPAGGKGKETPSVNAEGLKLTMVGGSAGGFWSLVGEGTGNILRQAIPNTQFSYELGSGVKNILSVASGKVPLGLAQNFEIITGLKGEEPFKEKVAKVTALATIYNNAPHHIVISKEFADKYGITSMEDIAKKKPPIRAAVNQRGNLLEKVNRIIFEAYGISYDDIKKWGGEVYYEPYKVGADLMKDNKADWIGASVFAPDGIFLELSTSKPVVLLSINEKAQKMLKEQMGMQPGVIKAGSYKFQSQDIITVNAAAMIMAEPKMTDDQAYTITKTLVENLDKIRAIHKDLKVLTSEIMADVAPATLHPGAAKYYKEKGILK